MKHFEVYINNRGNGQCPTNVAEWPKGTAPIIYAHFLTEELVIKNRATRIPAGQPLNFRADQLLYVGERAHVGNYVNGFKSSGYEWLNKHKESTICSVYWELPTLFENKNARNTLEAMIYSDLFQRYQMHPHVLRYNGGMQYTRAETGNLAILQKKYQILADLAGIGI